jgi:P4 family phage/plasmid primase-like protien
MARKFRISTGKSRLSPTITRKSTSWKKLAKRLLSYDVIDLTFDEYSKLDRETQSAHKDVGYFIGGWFNQDKRLLSDMATRCCIVLDIDHLDIYDLEEIAINYEALEYVVHSTLKHSELTPRLRLVFPLQRDITPDKYEPVARGIAARIGMDIFDDTTFQPARIMFWPAVTRDGDVFKHHNKGMFLDADAILDKYEDWQDFSEWPHSSRVKAVRPSTKKAEDPLTKKGIIGAFNRTYDIHAAIERFELPYESTDHDNRYSVVGASGPSGAVVYDDVFLYSHHESDVVGQQNVNAWDLVRLHRFGESDASKNLNDVPIMQHPSSKQMAAMAASIPEVEKELRTPAHEMEDLGSSGAREVDTGGSEGLQEKNNEQADLTFDTLLNEISEINPEATNLLAVAKSMVPRIAAAKLEPQDIDVLAATLRLAYPKPHPAKAAVVAGIKQASKRLVGEVATDGHLKDMERELISAALTDHYSNGDTLKRVGKKCWTYEQGVWAMEGDEPVRGKLASTFTRLREERPEDMLPLVATVGEGKTSALVKSVWGMMCDDLSTKESRDDPLQLQRSFALPVINCMNCEIYIDIDGVVDVRDHDPHNFYTTRIDTQYDPKATCPEWDRFMSMVFSNTCDSDDMVRHFEELGGYVVQFSRWLKTWVMFQGPTDTGKSSAAMVLQELLGNAYTGKPMAKLNNVTSEFAEAGLIGKLLMVDDDFAYDGHLPDGFLKTYSEEKPVTTSIKYGDDVNFKARALPLILSNHYPVTRDTTGAFIERALVIPFTHRIIGKDKDDQRRADMMKELPGILNRFLAGISRLRKRGTWDRPLDCVEVEQVWKTRSNPALQFIADCLDTHASTSIKRSRLYDVYFAWNREQSGHGSGRQFVMKKAQFYERMDEQLGAAIKSSGEFVYRCVALKHGMEKEMADLDGDF